MKGKAGHGPNHVEWVNGFKSNMPDWDTAKVCAASHELLIWAKEARTVLLTVQRPGAFNGPYDEDKLRRVINHLFDVITVAEFGPQKSPSHPLDVLKHHVSGAIERGEATAIVSMPVPFPKPPGVK